MRCSFVIHALFAAALFTVLPGPPAEAQQGSDTIRARDGTPIPVIPRAPEGMAEGAVWIPPMPPLEATLPPEGWEPVGYEQPPMPYILLRLPRTNITRAGFPAIDFHVHAGELTTPEAYESMIALMDSIGMGAIINLNGGTGAHLDSTLAAGEAYRDRVVNFVTLNLDGINEPGWSAWMAGELERGFLAGAGGLKVSKALGQGARNPDGSFIQADDPRLDAVWAMAAKHDKPIMIHTSDSVGRFYPIGPLNERYEAGLWRHPGDSSGNLYESGPPREVIEIAREKMLAKHPRTRFVLGHMAMLYYDPARLGTLLDTYPNADLETSAAIQDLGRAPRLWREFFLKYQDRILFGTDGNRRRTIDDFWTPHWRFLETFDEHFFHPAQVRTPGGSPGHGRYNIYGIGLPDEVLRKIYFENALRHLSHMRDSIERQLAERGG